MREYLGTRITRNIDYNQNETNQNLQVDHIWDHQHLKEQTLNLQLTHEEFL